MDLITQQNLKFLQSIYREIEAFDEHKRKKHLERVLVYYDLSFGSEKHTYDLLLDKFAELNEALPKSHNDFIVSPKTRKHYIQKLLSHHMKGTMMGVPSSCLDPDIKQEVCEVPKHKGIAFVPRNKKL